jgi:hypothetical protein
MMGGRQARSRIVAIGPESNILPPGIITGGEWDGGRMAEDYELEKRFVSELMRISGFACESRPVCGPKDSPN